jgi:predicted DNA-binding ribbon-helix-helix protein
MCGIFSRADPILYESRSRSVRIHGVITSIRLENQFWDVLAEIAKDEGITTNQFIAKLYDEIIQHHGEVANLASFLRVSCLRYMALVAGSSGATLKSPTEAGHDGRTTVIELNRQKTR